MNEKTWKHTYNLQIVNSNQKIAGELLNLVYCMYNYIASIVAVSIFNLQLPPPPAAPNHFCGSWAMGWRMLAPGFIQNDFSGANNRHIKIIRNHIYTTYDYILHVI